MTGGSAGLSIFDLDRTLTKRPTYSLFLLFAARRVAPWRLLLIPALAPRLLRYKLGRATRGSMKEAMHALTLGPSLDRSIAERVAADFAEQLTENGIYSEGRALLRQELSAGQRVILATAAPALYAVPFAQRLGIADVVSTRPVWSGDRLTHSIDGENCYGHSKLAMIEAYLRSAQIDRRKTRVRFYSDHASDLPTFEWADDPVAVNPSARLRKIARERGWRVLDW